MKYPKEWEILEEKYNRYLKNNKRNSTVPGLCLSDVLIMHNWISYARGIRDESVSDLQSDIIFNHKIFNMASSRLR